jgi:hypothetical protein
VPPPFNTSIIELFNSSRAARVEEAAAAWTTDPLAIHKNLLEVNRSPKTRLSPKSHEWDNIAQADEAGPEVFLIETGADVYHPVSIKRKVLF